MDNLNEQTTSVTYTYRPEIDGLRAVAVILVVLFHANLGFPGGYVGVDVFFVISGYLITSLLLRDIEAGTFSLTGFWERRARRIGPALAMTVLATLVAGYFLFLPRELDWLARSALGQALMVANFYFFRNTNYFSGDVDEMPLLHTWSLAVEEQFYLLFPLVLLLIRRRLATRRLLSVFLGMTLAGLVFSILAVSWSAPFSFYLLPPRAWELLAGSCVALAHRHQSVGGPDRRWIREVGASAALAAIFLPAFFYDAQTRFPGIAAAPPVLGAAVFAWVRNTAIQRILSAKPVVFVGLISYSLYLWHWPVFAFAKYWDLSGELPAGIQVGLLTLAILLAIVSYRWVETPFRRKRLCHSKKGIFVFAGASTAVILVVAAALIFFRGAPGRYRVEIGQILAAYRDRSHVGNQNETQINQRALPFVGKRESPARFLVWGDSHAQAALPAFGELANERGIKGYYVTHAATAPVCGAFFPSNYGLNDKVLSLGDALVEFVRSERIPDIFLVAYWSLYQKKNAALLEHSLPETIERLTAAGVQVHIVLDVPTHHADVPKALAKERLFGADVSTVWCRLEEHRERNSILYSLAAADSRAVFLDAAAEMLKEDPRQFKVREGLQPYYYDHQHLSGKGAISVFLPMLREYYSPTVFPDNL